MGGIKLIKVCSELNVGIQTVFDYCSKIGQEIPMNLNHPIGEDLYLLLKKKFIKDFDEKAEMKETSQLPKTPSPSPETKETQTTQSPIEHIADEKPNIEVKIVGSIDLTSIEKKNTTKTKTKTNKIVETHDKPLPQQNKEQTPLPQPTPKQETSSQQTENGQEGISDSAPVENLPTPKEETEVLKTDIVKPHVTIVGSIDIDAINKTKNKKTTPAENKSNTKKTKKKTKQDSHPITTQEEPLQNLPADNATNTPDISEDTTIKETNADTQQEKDSKDSSVSTLSSNSSEVSAEKDDTTKNEIFKIPIAEVVSQPKILGKIDLSTINQTMRPARKTKEEKLKEREEKFNQAKKNKESEKTQNKEKSQPSSKNSDAHKPFAKTENANIDIEDKDNIKDGRKHKRERIKSNKVDITSEQHPRLLKNKRERKNYKFEINSEEVQKQVKDTYARLNSNKGKTATSKHKRERRELEREKLAEAQEVQKVESSVLKLTEFVTANDLANMMNVPVNKVIATCMTLGILVSINQRLDAETINIVAEEFGFTTEYISSQVVEKINSDEVVRDEDIERRCPVVTVMGHVDHGKTSLLDHIRNANVIAGEAGGITQHIGAYNVQLKNGEHITFLDTPGHEAFTAMRARGTKITDIAIIVIAADDAVMPQTIEAINHAQAANVPMIFAINKCDKPGANPDKIKEQLANMNILVEDWGGKYQSQNISAKRGDGVYELLEKVLLEAELLDLRANPKRRAKGTIVESSLDKGRGYVATLLVSDGTLHVGDIILAGTYHGKIKAMFNERGKSVTQVLPGEPCSVLGFNGAPQAGDEFNVLPSEHEARSIANKREQLQREQSIRTRKHLGLEEIGRRLAIGDFKELNIVVKGDVDGSVEAITDSLIKLSSQNVQVNVIHGAVGAISDSDVLLAVAANAIIIGFNVRPTSTAKKMADTEEVDIRIYSIIYDAINDVKAAMTGMLAPEIKEEVTATVEVLQTFHISKVGTIAGCIVRDGKAKRTNKCRIIRDGIVIHTGEILSLKHGKDDIKEIGLNQECGISIKSFNDIKEHDIIETYEQVEVAQPL